MLLGYGVGRRRNEALIGSGQSIGEDLETNCRTLLDGYVMLHEQRHIRLQGKLNNLRQISQPRLRQYPLEVEAAEAGLLSKTHVNQLHPLPHLRAAKNSFEIGSRN